MDTKEKPPRPKKVDPKIERRLLRDVGRAIGDFALIAEGDRILVGLSGGKDSLALLLLLRKLQRRSPVRFTLAAAHVDDGYVAPDDLDRLQAFASAQDVTLHLRRAPIRSLVERHLARGELACPLCSRMRRGTLYSLARELGYHKLALGHHLDDALETLLMNLFYAGSLRAMAPHLLREDGPPAVIRPLAYALERDIIAYTRALDLPLFPCTCPSCDPADPTNPADPAAPTDPRRRAMKRLIDSLEAEHPDVRTQMRRALANVDLPSLHDPRGRSSST